MSEDHVSSYFKELHKLIDDNRIIPSCSWNIHKTGLQYQNKPVKSAAPKGMKVFYGRTSDSRESVTIVACVSAAGEAKPPLCIAKGKTERSIESFATYLGLKMPSGRQKKGWMKNSLGVEWSRSVFLKNCGSRRPHLLLLDSHSSHEVLELLEIVKEERIHILALPSHNTQLLQPLDRVVFKTLQSRL